MRRQLDVVRHVADFRGVGRLDRDHHEDGRLAAVGGHDQWNHPQMSIVQWPDVLPTGFAIRDVVVLRLEAFLDCEIVLPCEVDPNLNPDRTQGDHCEADRYGGGHVGLLDDHLGHLVRVSDPHREAVRRRR